jgi:hypothetical protein
MDCKTVARWLLSYPTLRVAAVLDTRPPVPRWLAGDGVAPTASDGRADPETVLALKERLMISNQSLDCRTSGRTSLSSAMCV